MDIEDKRFSNSFYSMIDSEVKSIANEIEINYEETFREKKNEYITNILYKKAGQRNKDIDEFNQLVLKNLREMEEIRRFFINPTFTCEEKKCAKNFNLSDDNLMSSMTEIFKSEYEKYLKFKYFDERIFLMEKDTSDCSPVKLTPFKRQKIINQDFAIKKPAAFKSLDFDTMKKTTNISHDLVSASDEEIIMNKPLLSQDLNNFSMNLKGNSNNNTHVNILRDLEVKELTQVQIEINNFFRNLTIISK